MLLQLQWYHDDKEVKQGGRYNLIAEKDGNSYFACLEIEDVGVEDAGKYRITAKNAGGENSATISLNFDSKCNALTAMLFSVVLILISAAAGTKLTAGLCGVCQSAAQGTRSFFWAVGLGHRGE